MGPTAASVVNRLLQRNIPKSKYLSTDPKALSRTVLTHLNAGRLREAVSVLFASPVPFPFSLYDRLFQICSSKAAIVEVRKVESHLITFSPTPPIFLLNSAILSYGKCGCLEDARELFEEMPQKDGGSWNAMITAYAQGGCGEKALWLFFRMNRLGIRANAITFASVLGSCAATLALFLSEQIHGLIVKYGFVWNVILGSSLVDIYGKCGVMSGARKMFDEIENPNAITWNVIVSRYFEMGNEKEAVVMFFKMIRENTRPLNFTVSKALIACSSMSALLEGIQIHGVAIRIGYEEDEVVSSSLIDMYVKCGDLESAHGIFELPSSKNLISWTSIVSGYAMNGRVREARELFNEMPDRSVITWNAMLSGYTRSCQWEEALELVSLMRKETQDIDNVTLGLILNVCSGLSNVELGKQVHGFIYRRGLYSVLFVGNALLHMYGECGNLRSARLWFHQMSHQRDTISWNALLTSHVHNGFSAEAMAIFGGMQCETTPSKFTLATLLSACANIFALRQGKEIHGFMIRNDYEIDVAGRGALVDIYSKCHCLEYAVRVFKEATSRDLNLWNSMILGCCYNGGGRHVLKLFELMEKEGVKPDHITFQGLLLACVFEGLAKLGTEYFNSMSSKFCIIPRVEHYESMIELNCRHGLIDELEDFINRMPFEPTVTMWRRVLITCTEHGHSRLGKRAAEKLKELSPSDPLHFQIMDRSRVSK